MRRNEIALLATKKEKICLSPDDYCRNSCSSFSNQAPFSCQQYEFNCYTADLCLPFRPNLNSGQSKIVQCSQAILGDKDSLHVTAYLVD